MRLKAKLLIVTEYIIGDAYLTIVKKGHSNNKFKRGQI